MHSASRSGCGSHERVFTDGANQILGVILVTGEKSMGVEEKDLAIKLQNIKAAMEENSAPKELGKFLDAKRKQQGKHRDSDFTRNGSM